eukprot:TRINITY_DN109675_c0_g1_i1.p1 TRINITY_DN109675_c0_g1~~TRINITY_DN109675_c0_g1_i1.p1  ORF type:complete len:179 (-),score=29.32 TRINITY_DN109675_c0_g1_i1:61-597(-)
MPSTLEANPWQRDKQWQTRISSEANWSRISKNGPPPPATWSAGLIPIRFGTPDVVVVAKKTSAETQSPSATLTEAAGSRPGTCRNDAALAMKVASGPQTPRTPRTAGPTSARVAAANILGPKSAAPDSGSATSTLRMQLDEERQRRQALEDEASKLREALQSRQSSRGPQSWAAPSAR